MNIAQALKVVGVVASILILGLIIAGLYFFMSIQKPVPKADNQKSTEVKPYTITSSNLTCTKIELPVDQKPVNSCSGSITIQGEGASRKVTITNQTKLSSSGAQKDLSLINTLRQNKTPITYVVTPSNMAMEIRY